MFGMRCPFWTIAALACFLVCFHASASLSSESEETAFYVAPDGNDSWSGRLSKPNADATDGPFATLSRARNAIRQHKASEGLSQPVTVYLRAGTYFLPETLVLTPEDSGTAEYPVTYSAFPGESPLISGGSPIEGWKKGSKGVWYANIPEAGEGKWKFQQLFVNGVRRFRPRLPEKNFFSIDQLPGVDATTPFYTPSNSFRFAPGDLRESWAYLDDVEVVVPHFWVSARLPIATVSESTREVTLQCYSRLRLTDNKTLKGARYYVENVLEALDAPGEWYLEAARGRLHYIPEEGKDMAGIQVVAPRLETLIRFEGDTRTGKYVKHIRLRGLSFSHTEYRLPPGDAGDLQGSHGVPGAITAVGAQECRIEACRLVHLGGYGIDLGRGCSEVRIDTNAISDMGGGGIKISGGDAGSPLPDRTGRNFIVNNRIDGLGQIFHGATGILLMHTADNIVAFNEVDHLYYTGISVGWVWGYGPNVSKNNIIAYNHLHDIGRGLLSDLGAIYLLGNSPGTVVYNNELHDVDAHGFGGWGIYLDEGCSNVVVENNIVYRTKDGSLHQHYGRDNIVRNNIFALSREAQLVRSKPETHISLIFERNIVYWKYGLLLGTDWADTNYRIDRNLYFRPGSVPIQFFYWSFEDWQKRGNDLNSLIDNPLFRDPENGDFSLLPDSPAFKIGFEPIDVRLIGPQK